MTERVRPGEGAAPAPAVDSARGRRRRRQLGTALFVLYAVGLATATHWPDVKLPGPEGLHPDKFLHVGAFAIWTWLLLASGLIGDWRRPGAQGLALLIGVFTGAVDEATQAFPGLGREVSFWDAGANAAGAGLAVAAAAILATRRRRGP